MKNTLEYWKNKFEKLISFLHDKLHSWYDKDDKYIDVVNEMYDDNVLDDDDIEELNLNKEKLLFLFLIISYSPLFKFMNKK